jgi:indole-3-glycerol phosphate synthase
MELKGSGGSKSADGPAARQFEGLLAAGGILDRIVEAKAARLLKSRGLPVKDPGTPQTSQGESSGKVFLGSISAAGRINVIAEIKRRSPSKGVIRADFDPVNIAHSYGEGGAAALSVLTEEDFFDGSLEYLTLIRTHRPNVPLLRKDFIFDEAAVHESKSTGAGAMLLITAILRDDLLERLIALANSIDIAPLVEVHTSGDMERALGAGATLIGVNNRDLTDFSVSLNTSLELAAMAPQETTLVSESGISTGDDVARLRDVGFSAFLVGEHLMRAADPGRALGQLIAEASAFKGGKE